MGFQQSYARYDRRVDERQVIDRTMAPFVAAEANIACDVKGVSPAAATMSAHFKPRNRV